MKNLIQLTLLVLILSACASIPNEILTYPVQLNVHEHSLSLDNSMKPTIQIDATEFEYPYQVEAIVVDSLEMKALVRTRKPDDKPHKTPAYLIYHDLVNNEILWVIQSYAWDPNFLNDKIIIQGKGKVFALDKKSGSMIWERPGNYFLYHLESNVGLTGSLEAFDLGTGATLWKRKISNEFGWNEHDVRDSVLIAAVDGIHSFDLRTGEGWDIEMSTGKTNEVGTAAANIGLGVLAALTGTSASTVESSIWTNMTSNLLFDDEHIYFSAKDNLVCVDKLSGQERWSTTIPFKKTAKTILKSDGHSIVVVNTGSCHKDSQLIKYGTPFIAKYDKVSGEQLFFNFMDSETSIKDIYISARGYYIISSETLLHLETDGKELAKLRFDNEKAEQEFGEFLFFSDEDGLFAENMVFTDNKYEPLANYFKHNNMPLAITDKGIIIFNESFEVDHWFQVDHIFYSPYPNSGEDLYRSYAYFKYKSQLDLYSEKMLLYQKSNSRKNYNSYKSEYDQILNGRSELLSNVFVIESDGNYKGNIHVENPMIQVQDKYYYRSDNSLVLVASSSINH